jgi:hypothetical protein
MTSQPRRAAFDKSIERGDFGNANPSNASRTFSYPRGFECQIRVGLRRLDAQGVIDTDLYPILCVRGSVAAIVRPEHARAGLMEPPQRYAGITYFPGLVAHPYALGDATGCARQAEGLLRGLMLALRRQVPLNGKPIVSPSASAWQRGSQVSEFGSLTLNL